MYTPKPYRETDTERQYDFIERHSFATLVSTDESHTPRASHIPICLFRDGPQPTLFAHVAKANPLWRSFRPDHPLLLIFQGPHAYITPRWYERPDVPTWNYAAVHVYGKPTLVDDAEQLLRRVTRQVKRFEGPTSEAFRIEHVLPESLQRDLRGIVGFEIVPESIEATFKLSQKLSATDFGNVITGLTEQRDPNSLGVAKLMALARPDDAPRIKLQPGVTLRRAERSDVATIVRLLADDPLGQHRDSSNESLAPAYYEGFDRIDVDPNQELLVVESDNQPIGTLQLTTIPGLSRQGSTRLLIEAVRIAAEYRGKGIGGVLFQWVIARARATGFRVVQLTTDKSRQDAHRFYERLGFITSHEGLKLHL